MQIAYVTDIFPAVSETFVRDEVGWMARRGHLVKIFSFQIDKTLLQTLDARLPDRVRPLTIRYIGRSRRPAIIAKWLLRAPDRFLRTYKKACQDPPELLNTFWNAAEWALRLSPKQFDIIHVHFAGPAVQTARYASLLTGIPFTVCVHHYDLFFRPPANYPALTRDAALVFTISKYNRQYLVNNYDIPADTIRVVHCGIDPEKFCPGKLNARQAGQPFSLISVGRLVDNKGHRYLIDACAILAQKGLQFTLKIIGDGKLRGCLEDRILTLGLAEHVKLLGGQSTEAVRSALHQADMFVLASLSEGVPVALMEAMATELPVIATRVRGVPELVEHDNTGLLVEAEDAVGLAEAIQRLAGDEMLRTRLGHAGRVKVSEEFNAETEYMEILKLWRQEVIR